MKSTHSESATVCCVLWSQHLRGHREAIIGWRLSQFVLAISLNVLKDIELEQNGHPNTKRLVL